MVGKGSKSQNRIFTEVEPVAKKQDENIKIFHTAQVPPKTRFCHSEPAPTQKSLIFHLLIVYALKNNNKPQKVSSVSRISGFLMRI
jgi:hypothetical protein